MIDNAFIIDYDIGVLQQFLLLHQQEIFQGDNTELDAYLHCLEAMESYV